MSNLRIRKGNKCVEVTHLTVTSLTVCGSKKNNYLATTDTTENIDKSISEDTSKKEDNSTVESNNVVLLKHSLTVDNPLQDLPEEQHLPVLANDQVEEFR